MMPCARDSTASVLKIFMKMYIIYDFSHQKLKSCVNYKTKAISIGFNLS